MVYNWELFCGVLLAMVHDCVSLLAAAAALHPVLVQEKMICCLLFNVLHAINKCVLLQKKAEKKSKKPAKEKETIEYTADTAPGSKKGMSEL